MFIISLFVKKNCFLATVNTGSLSSTEMTSEQHTPDYGSNTASTNQFTNTGKNVHTYTGISTGKKKKARR